MNVCLYRWYLVSLALQLNMFGGGVVLFFDIYLKKMGVLIKFQAVSRTIIIKTKYKKGH